MDEASGLAFAFEREMGFALSDWCACLPGAVGGRTVEWGPGSAAVPLGAGRVSLSWAALPPRRIALLAIPRLRVRFEASGVAAADWQAFMRHFDLYMQRGGG